MSDRVIKDGAEYTVKLDLFEGPLDLLLFLIRKNEIDIYDIPIASITEQYLEYLDLMKSLNVNIAADFLSMASTLVYVKSRLLLPSGSADDEEDPRMEIVRPLLEYMQFKEAAELLGERELLNRDVFVRDFMPEEMKEFEEERELVQVSLFELLAAFKLVMEQHSAAKNVRIPSERPSVKDLMEVLLERLVSGGPLLFLDLFQGSVTRVDLVTTFLAVLELVKMRKAKIFQSAGDGLIHLYPVADGEIELEET